MNTSNTHNNYRNPSYFILSIDTEEDQWGAFGDKATVKNIDYLTDTFQRLCEQYGIRPTYLVNAPVAETPSSQKIIQELARVGNCEIGMHLHPWRTSPHASSYQFPKDSHMTNYSFELIGKKINHLFHSIQNLTQKPCRTFRAGRWSMSTDAMAHLYKLGVNIDTSITPYVSWEEDGGNNYSQHPMQAYKFLSPNFLKPYENGNAYEIPPSVGWTRGNLQTMHLIEQYLRKMPHCFRIPGILHRLNIIKKIWVSPEQENVNDMIMLCQNLLKQNQPYIHAMFHSTSLLPGASPFVQNKDDLALFYMKLERLFQYVQAKNLKPVTLCEYVDTVYSLDPQ